MTDTPASFRLAAWALLLLLFATLATAQTRSTPSLPGSGDYIVAVVNQELVTSRELEARIKRVREDAARDKSRLPPDDELRKQVLDVLIEERAQLTNARESGQRIEDTELDRAVANVATQNQLTLAQLRANLAKQGVDFNTFRNNIRDQLLMERVREREVNTRITITDSEIDALIDKRRAASGAAAQYNIAQILVSVPEGADAAVVAERRAKAEAARARVLAGEPFEAVAKAVSEDSNKAQGGLIGMRPAERLPDVFVEVVRPLKVGEVAPELLRTGAGFHVLKLVEKREGGAFEIQQTHARHILLRPSAQLSEEAARRRLAEFKRQIQSGSRLFEQVARDNSEDGSASAGGDLGWTSPGAFVPEFEEAMNALPINGISDPVTSRFGVHIIQVLERRQTTLDAKQQREQARNILREQKFDAAYNDWIRELRARAYVEFREAPQ